IFAGLAIGVGMIMIFRHGASAGGFGILAAYMQERHGVRAGYVQGALDLVVVAASLALVEPLILLFSVIGAVLLNFVLAINHRPGRYFG
ncbi:MAG: YitT family protein, partial [Dietzia cercidiphylli]